MGYTAIIHTKDHFSSSTPSPISALTGLSSLVLFWRVGNRTFCLANRRVRSVVGITPGNLLAELRKGSVIVLRSKKGTYYTVKGVL